LNHPIDPADERQPISTSGSVNYSAAWKLVGDGAMIISATILTDFLFGIGIFDDVVTIPMGLSMMGCGIYRLIFPVLTRSTIVYAAHRTVHIGAGMTLNAAHAR
jgi:hypothetical protein